MVRYLLTKTEVHPHVIFCLYRDVAKWYRWVPRNKKKEINPHWKRRKRNQHHTVGRVRHVPPSMECKELFHFRLLLNTRPGPKGFEDIRTFVDEDGNITVFPTYQEGTFHMGLVQDNKEWEVVLEEVTVVAMAVQIRSLLVIILTHGLPQNANILWENTGTQCLKISDTNVPADEVM